MDEKGQEDSAFVDRESSQRIYCLIWRKDLALKRATEAEPAPHPTGTGADDAPSRCNSACSAFLDNGQRQIGAHPETGQVDSPSFSLREEAVDDTTSVGVPANDLLKIIDAKATRVSSVGKSTFWSVPNVRPKWPWKGPIALAPWNPTISKPERVIFWFAVIVGAGEVEAGGLTARF